MCSCPQIFISDDIWPPYPNDVAQTIKPKLTPIQSGTQPSSIHGAEPSSSQARGEVAIQARFYNAFIRPMTKTLPIVSCADVDFSNTIRRLLIVRISVQCLMTSNSNLHLAHRATKTRPLAGYATVSFLLPVGCVVVNVLLDP